MCNMGRRGPALKVEDDELVTAISSVNGPFATAVEVAEEVGLSPERVRERLKELEDRGVLESKRAGSAKAYWRG